MGKGDVKTYNLRHVQNDNGRLETDTKTGNETTSDDGTKRSANTGKHLDDDTDHVDEAAEDDSVLATNPVGDITSNESAEEGTAGENGDDERLVGFVHGSGRVVALDLADEGSVTNDTVDVSGVISEEDTSKGGEGADHVGLPGDGGLDLGDVLGDGQADRFAGDTAGFLLHGCCCCR